MPKQLKTNSLPWLPKGDKVSQKATFSQILFSCLRKFLQVLKLENISFIKNSRQYPFGVRPDEINNPTL